MNYNNICVSFTGAQSTGKTTLLNRLKESEYSQWYYVDEVTRLVQREYGVLINEAGDDITQLLILDKHLHNAIKCKSHNTIMDRCIVDGLVYTQWLYRNGNVSYQTLNHAEHLFKLLIGDIDCIFLPYPGDVAIHDDGVRSTNNNFRQDVIKLFDDVLARPEVANKVIVVKGTVEERYNIIQITLQQLSKNRNNEQN